MLDTSSTELEPGGLGANVQIGGFLSTRLYNPTFIVDLGETHLATEREFGVHVTLSRNPRTWLDIKGLTRSLKWMEFPRRSDYVRCGLLDHWCSWYGGLKWICARSCWGWNLKQTKSWRSDTSGMHHEYVVKSHPFVETMDPYGVLWCISQIPTYIAIFIGKDFESAHFDFCLETKPLSTGRFKLPSDFDNWKLTTPSRVRGRELSIKLQPNSYDQWNICAERACAPFLIEAISILAGWPVRTRLVSEPVRARGIF